MSDAGASAAGESPAGESPAGESPAGEAPAVPEVHGHPLVDSLGAKVVHCQADGYLALARALRADGYDMLVGLTGVDYLNHPGRDLPAGIVAHRFEVVVELLAMSDRRRLRIRCQVPGDNPHLATLFDVWPGSEAHERETYDLFGVVFDGHPDPSRILMPEDWEGHPLRKDYASGRIPVQFKEAPGGH
jgi:NADH-quinone oxidoreductase subunit C